MFAPGYKHEEFSGELTEHVVGDDKHRFAGEAEPLQLHRGGDHRVGFSRPNDMGEQRVGCLQDAPDSGLLVSVELNCPAGAGQRQVVAVESANARVIERVVVQAAEPLPT